MMRAAELLPVSSCDAFLRAVADELADMREPFNERVVFVLCEQLNRRGIGGFRTCCC